MHRGHIKMFRKIRDHWIFGSPDEFRAWAIILMDVNHTSCRTKIGSRIVDCDRGEALFSLDTWASKFGKGWDKSKVRRFFSLLQSDQMIVLKNETQTTRLTVLNYSLYHGSCNGDETEMKRKRNADETRATPIEEGKEGEEGKEEPKPIFSLPAWIDKKKWQDFVNMRVKIKKPMTGRAKELAVGKLEKIKADGHDPNEVLDTSIFNNWKSIYPPKGQQETKKPIFIVPQFGTPEYAAAIQKDREKQKLRDLAMIAFNRHRRDGGIDDMEEFIGGYIRNLPAVA